MRHIQWFLYNHCGPAYRLDAMNEYVFLHTDARPRTPVGTLSFHVYSKLLHYAAGWEWVQSLTGEGDTAHWYDVSSYAQYRKEYMKTQQEEVHLHVVAPTEPYLYRYITQVCESLSQEYDLYTWSFHQDPQRYCSHEEFTKKYEKPPIMETYYRRMRKKTGILMEDGKPAGGKRNYDKQNRKFDKDFESFQELTIRETSE